MVQSGKPVGNMKFGLGIDGTAELGNTLDKLTKQFKQAESSMKANIKAFDGASDSVEALEQKYSDLTDVVKIQEKRIEVLNKRRDDAIKKYGAESKQVQSLSTQINNATAKYNGLTSQLEKTSKEYIDAKSGLTQLSKEMKQNERETQQQVKALKDAGDSAGALEAKQEGLKRSISLTEKAIEAQKRAIEMSSQEFGENSREVEEARQSLSKLESQAKLSSKALKSMENASDGLSDIKGGADEATDGVGGLLDGVMSLKGGAVIGAVTSLVGTFAGLTDGINESKDAINKFQGALGLSQEGAENYTQMANELVAEGLGSLDEMVDAMSRVEQNSPIPVFGEDLQNLTRYAVSFSKTFDTDVNETLRGAGAIMNSWGLDSKQAFDLMTLGAQNGLNKSDELADNLAEYAPIWAQMGYTADEAFSTMLAGLDGGAYNLDKVNDLVKEIGISIVDGRLDDNMDMFSQKTRDVFQAFKDGKATQADVTQSMLNDFSKMDSSYESLNKASTVWSALGEDNSMKMIKALAGVENNFTEVEGAIDGVVDSAGNTTAWDAFSSSISSLKNEVGMQLLPIMSTMADTIENFTKDILPKVGQYLGEAFGKLQPILEPVGDYIKTITELLWNMGAIVFEKVYPLLKPILDTIFNAFGSIFKQVSEFYNQYGKQIMEAFMNFLNFISPLLKIVIGLVSDFVNNVIGFIQGMVDTVMGIIKIFTGLFTGDFKLMWDGVKQLFSGAINAIWNWLQILFFAKIIKGVKGLASGFGNTISGMWTSVKNFFTTGTSNAWNLVKGWASNIGKGVSGIKDNFIRVIGNLWDGVKRTFSGGMDTVVNWIKGLPKKLGDGITGGAHFLKDAFKGMFNGAMKIIEKPVNGIIGGANWVLEKLGMDKLKTWEAPEYAKGTPNGGHPVDGPMTVNDGRGAEMVIDPSGQAVIPKGKNVTMWGRKGTHVLTAEETAQVLGHKRPKFAYKKGTGFFDKITGGVKNIWNGAKNMAKSAFDKVSSVVGDVWDYATNPSKLVEKVFSSVVDTSGLIKYPLDVARGMIKKATSALTSRVTEAFESGNLDTSVGTAGVYKYLANVARKVIAKYPGMRVTSGYRPGDPYSHGSRNAIDVAFPASMNGSSKYRQAGNYAFDNFKSQVGYVIALNKVRDRVGTSGTGIHDAWTNWASGGHMDHLHINGVKDPQSQGGAIDTTATGSGVDRWRATAKRALQMTGQWTTANLNALMNQMRTESNGNPRAINLWDINAQNGIPSKGLMQVIDPTFRQYAMKPYNRDIYDPLSNILASIRYTLARYGSLTRGWRGTGYANGGLITREHLAMVGEGNKPEMVIPLDKAKRSRAMYLLAEAQKRLGVSQTTVVAGQGSNDELIAQLIVQQQQTNALLQALLEKDTDVYLDKRKVTAELNPALTKDKQRGQMVSNRRQGRLA